MVIRVTRFIGDSSRVRPEPRCRWCRHDNPTGDRRHTGAAPEPVTARARRRARGSTRRGTASRARLFSASVSGRRSRAPSQVVPQVVDVLDADREAHQRVRDRRRFRAPAAAPLDVDSTPPRLVACTHSFVLRVSGRLPSRPGPARSDDPAHAGIADLTDGGCDSRRRTSSWALAWARSTRSAGCAARGARGRPPSGRAPRRSGRGGS